MFLAQESCARCIVVLNKNQMATTRFLLSLLGNYVILNLNKTLNVGACSSDRVTRNNGIHFSF